MPGRGRQGGGRRDRHVVKGVMVSQPNILFLVADQFRGDCLGCAGNPLIRTPHLDQLAADGTRFACAYSPDPICVPARATMITGNYPHRCTGRKSNGGCIRAGQLKLPEYLAEHGYVTYASGKLHYPPYAGPDTPRLTHGFQHTALAESGRIINLFDPCNQRRGLEDYADFLKDSGWGGYTRAHGVGNNDITPAGSPLPAELNVDAWVASRGLAYLDQHRREHPDRPFFLNLGFPKPHAPYDPPAPWDRMYDPRQVPAPAVNRDGAPRNLYAEMDAVRHGLRNYSPEALQVVRAHYYGLISFQDAQIGRVIAYLREHGLYENTLVVFMADHGDMLGDFGYLFKCSMYEGSCRVPLLIRPPQGERGQVSQTLAGLQDVVPTVLAQAGLRPDQEFDGRDLSAVLCGGGDAAERTELISYSLSSPYQTYMVRSHRHKYIYNQVGGIEELYDLQQDPREEHNLAAAAPDIVAALRGRMLEWARSQGDAELLDAAGKPLVSCLDRQTFAFSDQVMGWRWY